MNKLYTNYLRTSAERNQQIIKLRKAGMSVLDLATAYGLTSQRVSKICAGLRPSKRK